MTEYTNIDGEVAAIIRYPDGRKGYEILPAQEVNWTKTARKFSERRDYRRQYLAERQNNSLTITIGQGDLPEGQWSNFKATVWNTAERLFPLATREEGYGMGRWNGYTEANYSLVIRSETTLDTNIINVLKEELERIAKIYKQDAIALTLGTSELIHG